MLTTKGKNILAKYLVNQAPGYAGYIAVGCGANPLSTMTFDVSLANVNTITGTATITTSSAHNFMAGDVVFIKGIDGAYDGQFTIASIPSTTTFTINASLALANVDPVINGTVTHNFAQKNSLDFEMFRVPIVSRGIINEDSLTKVVFTAELPNLEQYGMTEIGVYPSGSNPTASTIDSRVLFNFSDTENWEYHSDVVEKAVSYVGGAGYANAVININTLDNFVLINSYDPIFDNYYRMTSKEQPRFESKTLMLRGNTSAINTSPTIYSIYENSALPENQSHIHNTGLSFSFNQNSADDILKLGFSVITEAASSTQYSEIGGLNLIVQFTDSETLGSSEYANMQFSLTSTDLKANNANTQYYVVQKSLSELKTTSNFQWSSVNTVKIFASAFANVGTNVSASSLTSNIATITTSTAHGLVAGDAILITGRPEYNGLYEVATNVNATAFTYSITASNLGSNTTDGGTVTKLLGNHWIALDGLRFENVSSATANPLYGLTGYSLLAETSQSSNGASITNYPVVKQRNTNNFVEFKFALDTGGDA